jgi:hypothetical protein
MFGLNSDVDLSFLVGAGLEQVAVGENEVILNLSSRISIMVASDLRLSPPSDRGELIKDAPDAGAALIRLLGSTIVAATGADGALSLEWSDGSTLAIYDSWPNYESYTITHGNGIIVV